MSQSETIEEAVVSRRKQAGPEPKRHRAAALAGIGAITAILIVAGELGSHFLETTPPPPVPPPIVGVSHPLVRDIDQRLSFLGQFAAIRSVELRAQVGGTLTAVDFSDGAIVRRGTLLFEIDPEPYQIRVDQARAQLESASARLGLAGRELTRAQRLKSSDAGSTENVDQKVAEKEAAVAAVDGAKAGLHDALFDLDKTRVYAPFDGRIGTHLVSPGNLVAGSRAASSPTTLLSTLVSLDPIWLNFDMSEADYAAFLRERSKTPGPPSGKVDVTLGDGTSRAHQGSLDFVDNAIDRASGTIHARATLRNGDGLLTPGAFGRVRLAVSPPAPALLVPDAAVLSDQGDHSVYVLGHDNVASLKKIETGDLRGGLRVVKSGLAATDIIVVDGIPAVRAGAPVRPQPGTIRFGSDQD